MRRLLNTLYVTTPHVYAHLDNENVVIDKEGERLAKVPLRVVESIVLIGSLGASPALMGTCIDKGIELSFLDMNGRFLARVDGTVSGNVLLRREQYRVADDKQRSLAVAKRFIAAKAMNQRSVLLRFRRDYRDRSPDSVTQAIDGIGSYVNAIGGIDNAATLRGVEGKAADCYFGVFGNLVLVESRAMVFKGRSRRPPKDPINALLSFFYSLLSHDVAAACCSVGLDPYVGFMHVDRSGRRGLALDLMEELRPHGVDRFVLSLVNRKQVDGSDFEKAPDGAVIMKDGMRKQVIKLWQERKRETVLHPFLNEKVPIGLVPHVQAKLLSRYLRGDLDDYPAFLWK